MEYQTIIPTTHEGTNLQLLKTILDLYNTRDIDTFRCHSYLFPYGYCETATAEICYHAHAKNWRNEVYQYLGSRPAYSIRKTEEATPVYYILSVYDTTAPLGKSTAIEIKYNLQDTQIIPALFELTKFGWKNIPKQSNDILRTFSEKPLQETNPSFCTPEEKTAITYLSCTLQKYPHQGIFQQAINKVKGN